MKDIVTSKSLETSMTRIYSAYIIKYGLPENAYDVIKEIAKHARLIKEESIEDQLNKPQNIQDYLALWMAGEISKEEKNEVV